MAGISQATYSTVAGPHAPPKVTVALLVIGSVLLLLAAALRDIRQLFFAHEFHHADNN